VADWLQRWSFALGKLASAVFVGLFFRLRAYGITNLPKQGGALLLSNHQSFLDPMLVGCPVSRPTFFMARDTLFRNPVCGAILRAVNAFPVRRGRPDRRAIRTAIGRLAAGELLVMFPEGTRTRDGELQPFKGGFRLLVRKANVPVIPVVIDGAYEAWPRSRLLPRPGPVRVTYGRCIPPAEFERLSDDEAAERVAREMSRMLDELRTSAACQSRGRAV